MDTLGNVINDPVTRFYYNHNFWKHVDVPFKEDPNICWEWTSATQNKGYGYWGQHKFLAHRLAFTLFYNRPIEKGKVLMHICDNTKCCNPHHLQEGTQAENIQDAASKGRLKGPVKHLIHPDILHKAATYQLNLTQTAKDLGCTRRYLLHKCIQYRNKHGIPHRRSTNKPVTEADKAFIKENFPTLSGAEIGRQIGHSRRVVNAWIKRMGLRSHILQN